MMIYVIFLVGLIIGSFLNVCIHRIPRRKSLSIPRSHCPDCGHVLSWWELIPVVSFIILKGKCSNCGVSIDWQYFAVEIFTAIIFMILFLNFNLTAVFYVYVLLFCFLIVGSGIDINYRIIPDVITIPGILIGFILSIFLNHVTITESLLGIFAVGGSLYLINNFIEGNMGYGDIKMTAMLGGFTGWQIAMMSIILGAFIGAINSLVLLVKYRNDEEIDLKVNTQLPFGPYLIFGAIITIVYFEIIIIFYKNLLF